MPSGKIVCPPCRQRAKQRCYERRARLRERARVAELFLQHERMGDEASVQHFYHDAIQHFEAALENPEIADADRLRITRKRALAAYLTGDSKHAGFWKNFTLEDQLGGNRPKKQTVELLVETFQFQSRDCRTKAGLPLLAQSLQLVGDENGSALYQLVNLDMALCLTELGYYNDAEKFICAAKETPIHDEHRQFAAFLDARYLASCGKANEAFAKFEEALCSSDESFRGEHNIGVVLDNYGSWALALGNVELAKACYERACSHASKQRITWHDVSNSLKRADVFIRTGQFKVAHTLVKEAIDSDMQVAQVTVKAAYVGIRIALRLNDRELLQRCAHPDALDLAFQSGEDMLIGRTAAAFAGLFVAQGRLREAQALVHRALGAVRTLALHWELAIEAASIGVDADIRRARTLLEERAALPSAGVPTAFLSLFDAIIARRRGRTGDEYTAATAAAEQFAQLQWHAYADSAKEMLDPENAQRKSMQFHAAANKVAFSNAMLPALTSRERQVASLASKGLTNREIAHDLAISENTVESHMASIMNRWGIRSRHQLVDLFNAS